MPSKFVLSLLVVLLLNFQVPRLWAQEEATAGDFIEPDIEAVIAPEQLQTFEKKNEADGVVLRYQFYVDQHGQEIKHGSYEEFYDGGTPMRVTTYSHGKPDGQQKWYHSNGALWMQFVTKRGLRHGTYKEYNRNGGIKVTRHYQDGKLISTRR